MNGEKGSGGEDGLALLPPLDSEIFGFGLYTCDYTINLLNSIISESFATNHADAGLRLVICRILCYNNLQRC